MSDAVGWLEIEHMHTSLQGEASREARIGFTEAETVSVCKRPKELQPTSDRRRE